MTAELAGVLWVHGEIEGRNANTAGPYARALAELISRMRTDLGVVPDLPFAMLMPWPGGAKVEPVLPAFLSGLDALERGLPRFTLVRAPAHSLEVYGDRYPSLDASPFDEPNCLSHYTEEGQRVVGTLFAEHVRVRWG